MDNITGIYVENDVLGIGCIVDTYFRNDKEYITVEFTDGTKRAFSAEGFLSLFKVEQEGRVAEFFKLNPKLLEEVKKDVVEEPSPPQPADLMVEIVEWLKKNDNYTVFNASKREVEFALNIDDHQSKGIETTITNTGVLSLYPDDGCIHFEYQLTEESDYVYEEAGEGNIDIYSIDKMAQIISLLDKKTKYTFFPNEDDISQAGIIINKNLFSMKDFLFIEELLFTFCTTSSWLFPHFHIIKPDTHDISYKDFVIISSAHKCIRQDHTLEKILAVMFAVQPDGEQQKVTTYAFYCKDCNEYYIKIEDYSSLKQYYPVLIIRAIPENSIKQRNETGSNASIFDNYALESVLKQCGYTVNQTDNLSPEQRRLILRVVIEEGLLQYPAVLNHLEWNIEKDGTERNKLARSKWRADIQYLKDYYHRNAREVGIRTLRYKQ